MQMRKVGRRGKSTHKGPRVFPAADPGDATTDALARTQLEERGEGNPKGDKNGNIEFEPDSARYTFDCRDQQSLLDVPCQKKGGHGAPSDLMKRTNELSLRGEILRPGRKLRMVQQERDSPMLMDQQMGDLGRADVGNNVTPRECREDQRP